MVATTKDITQADMWWRLTHIGVIFVPLLFTHFVYEFLKKETKPLVPILYVIGFFFLWANLFTNFFIANMRWTFNQFYYDSPPGIFYTPYTILFFALIIYTHILLWRAHKTAPPSKKTQISYFFIATLVGFAGGSLSFLPVYGIDLYPYGNLTVFLYPLIITYAIIQKQLFGIKTFLTQLLVGFIALLLFLNIFSSEATFDYIWKTILFTAFIGAGYLLIRSVMNEIKQHQELQRAYVKLKELDEAKSEFVSIASHQLRTPLTAIKGYISMIVEGTYGKLGPKQKKPMESVYQSNERLIGLVNDLLNISRIESGKIQMEWQKAKLENVIKNTIDELQIKAKEKKLKIVFQKPQLQLPSFRMDPGKMRNILLNIIDNAIRYTAKGTITITLTPKPQNRNLETKSVVMTVKDPGDGISKEELAHLFESFSRGKAGTRRWTEGAGLGLYIAKQFITMHKGKIWATSPGKGKGSTFFVEIPVQ